MSLPNRLLSAFPFALMTAALGALATPARAQEPPYPAEFRTREINANGVTIHVRIGGSGPAIVLIHGFGETGDMWASLAGTLVRNHTVIVPDLRGMGLSSKPASGFSKMNQATDIAALMDALKVTRSDVVAHDIGNMVAFAFAEKYPDRVTKLIVIDAPIPGIGPWDEIAKSPATWHFRFGGADMERLVKGRERIYLDRFWNEFSADPARFTERSRRHYAVSMRSLAQCIPRSSNIVPFTRMRTIIRHGWPLMENWRCPCWRWAPKRAWACRWLTSWVPLLPM